MPWADYSCPGCPGIVQNHPFSSALGAKEGAPWCRICEIQMVPVAAINLSLGRDSGSRDGFQKFEVHRLMPTAKGLTQVVETVDTPRKAHQIERDSEQRYKDHEGEPLRFRALHQNRSNMDENSFGTSGTIGGRSYSSGTAPSKPAPVTRHGTRKPKVSVAKGGGVSPLRKV